VVVVATNPYMPIVTMPAPTHHAPRSSARPATPATRRRSGLGLRSLFAMVVAMYQWGSVALSTTTTMLLLEVPTSWSSTSRRTTQRQLITALCRRPRSCRPEFSSTQAGQDDHSQIFLKARTDFTPAGRGQRAGLQSAESPQEVRGTSVCAQLLPTAPNGKPAGQSSHLLG
jgi:hypothetical protein